MDDEFKEIIKQFRRRYEQEYDIFVNIGVKINDNLLLINSAIIAVLIASNKATEFKLSIPLFFLSTFFSLLSIFIQKELSRLSSIKFLEAISKGEKAENSKSATDVIEFPSTKDLRIKSGYVSNLINLSLLSFFLASFIVLVRVFCV